MSSSNPVVEVAAAVQASLERQGLPFCIIGGMAVQRWGQPRVTEDVDAMIYTDLVEEDVTIARLLEDFEPRREDAVEFARVRRVLLLIDSPSRVGIDISLGAFDYERHAAERSSLAEFAPGVWLRTCSAEDLIVYKVFADRDLDWIDVKGILVKQRGGLDFGIIDRELRLLVHLKESPELWERWVTLRDRYRP